MNRKFYIRQYKTFLLSEKIFLLFPGNVCACVGKFIITIYHYCQQHHPEICQFY